LQQDVFTGRSGVDREPPAASEQTHERRPLSAFRKCAIQRSSFPGRVANSSIPAKKKARRGEAEASQSKGGNKAQLISARHSGA
jgi:hypothetical protein